MSNKDIESLYLRSRENFENLKKLYDQLVTESRMLMKEFEYIQEQNYEQQKQLQRQGLMLYRLKMIINEEK